MNTIVKHLKIHFDRSFEMLENMIDICPHTIWNEKAGGTLFSRHILRALTSALFWMRTENNDFTPPFNDRRLDGEFPEFLTKEELVGVSDAAREQAMRYFADKDDVWLTRASAIDERVTNVDAIVMQIRHIQYCMGHCDAALRERNVAAAEWLDYLDAQGQV